jgi:serine protease Do
MRNRFWSVTLSGLILVAGLPLVAPQPVAAQQMQMMPPSQAELIRGLLPTVVNITSVIMPTPATAAMNAAASSGKDSDRPKTFLGSGLVIDPSGVILTNNHVVAGAYDIRVMFSDGVRVPGRILATASITDLALVKVDINHPLAAVHWADSDKVQIGDPVFAIGNPLGLGLSVTSGIVSALNRNLMDTPYDDFIQTDAAINHGNSGGPLFDRNGAVIGVDTAIISPTTGSAGLGFAIPSNIARFIADRLMRDGQTRPGYLGFKIETVTPDVAAALDMPQAIGSIIDSVQAGGPAAAAGLQVGDVILRYDNETPSDERALLRNIAESTIGRPVPVTLLRAGRGLTLQVTPAAWPETRVMSGETPKLSIMVPANLGLNLRVLTADLRAQYGLRMQQPGVLIGGVVAGTDAYERGLESGDVIQAVLDVARAEHKAFILALVLPKVQQPPGPQWMALKILDGVDAGNQSARQ